MVAAKMSLSAAAGPGRAMLLAVTGIGLLSLMDAMIKGLAARYAVPEIAFLRYLSGSVLILALLAWRRPGWPSAATWRANGLRAVLAAATALTFFTGLARLPLAEALALSFLSPIFIALFAGLLLREMVRPRVWAALLLGLAGVLVVAGGQLGGGAAGEGHLLGIAAVLASALTYALSMVLLRARAARDSVAVIVAIQHVGPAALLAAPAASTWVPVAASDWPAFALVGALGVAGHLVLSRAYAGAEAARLAVAEYSALIWAVGLGYLAFGEVPGLATAAGSGLILAGSALAARR
ncbi:DMT family transporter [Methylobacterium sp. WSM2598]|uniref:DMT family transporter n=1 Tax=Methylobacterium sp. WSM2598 TaxID=398261 RepID=UPI0003785A5A|nr:DMT family transporter [Methylobacterium sp. WSM2598]